MSWYLAVLRKYATFDGRARRKEFWMFALFDFLIIAAGFALVGVTPIDGALSPVHWALTVLLVAYLLGMIVPSWAVRIRRMHDTGRSGWYLLLGLIPFVGGIIVLVMLCTEGVYGPNGYGPDPKQAERTPQYA